MTTHYIDPTRAAGGDGSISNPRRTWADTVASVRDGDTVLLAANQTLREQVDITTDNVTLGSYNGRRATIDVDSAREHCVLARRAVNVTVRDMNLAGATVNAFRAEFCANPRILYCNIERVENRTQPMNARAVYYSGGRDGEVEGCHFREIGNDCVHFTATQAGSGVVIRNVFRRFGTQASGEGDAVQKAVALGFTPMSLVITDNVSLKSNRLKSHFVVASSSLGATTIADNYLIDVTGAGGMEGIGVVPVGGGVIDVLRNEFVGHGLSVFIHSPAALELDGVVNVTDNRFLKGYDPAGTAKEIYCALGGANGATDGCRVSIDSNLFSESEVAIWIESAIGHLAIKRNEFRDVRTRTMVINYEQPSFESNENRFSDEHDGMAYCKGAGIMDTLGQWQAATGQDGNSMLGTIKP